jgi:hypothetical protein
LHTHTPIPMYTLNHTLSHTQNLLHKYSHPDPHTLSQPVSLSSSSKAHYLLLAFKVRVPAKRGYVPCCMPIFSSVYPCGNIPAHGSQRVWKIWGKKKLTSPIANNLHACDELESSKHLIIFERWFLWSDTAHVVHALQRFC